ncbi:biosynthetic peptidoglycan transglycosylase [Amorphus sp. 3PC139-8]|uniref:biosynthetic peptidoglycan transglycosylase n=1 Tax=Amorphus sp. 3PC139-8 TaxID=2735676 RepID=UPI00345D961F
MSWRHKFTLPATRQRIARYLLSAPDLARYTFKSRRVIWPPHPKSILIALNKSADAVIEEIDNQRFAYPIKCSLFEHDNISEIEWSVLLLEDRRFLVHAGVDFPRACLRVVRQLVTFRRVGGISTIEQQLVRTVLDDRRRTISRKIRESIVANAVSYRKRKFTILRTYLSIAYTGYRLTGIDAPSIMLFGKPAAQLQKDQADFIASLLVYPIPKKIVIPVHKVWASKAPPFGSTEEIFTLFEKIEPRWVERMRRRASYAARLRTYTVKPLYKIY